MIRTIPLTAGLPHQRFRVEIGGRVVTVRLYWSTRYEFYCVDLHDDDGPIALGRALHPGVDLLAGLNLGLGRLYLEGRPATVANLGIDNKLRHAS